MIIPDKDIFLNLKNIISKEKKIVNEMSSIINTNSSDNEKNNIFSHIDALKINLKDENNKIPEIMENIQLNRILNDKTNEKSVDKIVKEQAKKPKKSFIASFIENRMISKRFKISEMDQDVVKRIGKKRKEFIKIKEERPSVYARISSKFFSDISRVLIENKSFENITTSRTNDLIKTNIKFVPVVYLSILLFTTVISSIVAVLIFLFLLFFRITLTPPFIVGVTDMFSRLLTIFWILIIIPLATFLFMYIYPSLERKSIARGIEQELPFATINMSAIAGSMIEPTNIFSIIISTGEYPFLKRQFTKIINEINIYGHDLVTALKNSALTSPSQKLVDLYNGLSTNITSGGDLGDFLEKRAETLLLDYRLQRERYTRTAETFIDIYISVVIAAPMILMLLLMMIQISGLGLGLSTSTISLMMVLGVSVINFVFLVFLRLKQPNQ